MAYLLILFVPLAATLVLAQMAAGAQPVNTFAALAELIELGETVRVTYGVGQMVEGRALDITPASLTVMTAGVPLELDEVAVTRIRQRWDDPVRDGAVRGFLWGSVPTTVLYLYFVMEDGLVPADEIAAGLLMTVVLAGGMGAGLGALVDTWRREQRDIYRRAAGRVRVSPLLSRERFGAAVAIAWCRRG